MTNEERIQANNEELREAIAMAESLPNAGGGVQADWNQTDETAADFIKNKPFWDVEIVLFDKTGLEPVEEDGAYVLYEPAEFEFTEGAQYAVVIDGVEHNVECYSYMGLMPIIGNSAFVGGEDDNGLPFLSLVSEGTFVYSSLAPFSSLSITGFDTERIPEKYLPKSVRIRGGIEDVFLYNFSSGNLVTKAELSAHVNNGSTIYVSVGGFYWCIPVAVSIIGEYGTVQCLIDGRPREFYTAEYTPPTT